MDGLAAVAELDDAANYYASQGDKLSAERGRRNRSAKPSPASTRATNFGKEVEWEEF
jgi:hypothetical protein